MDHMKKVTHEDKVYSGDVDMTSAKNKMLMRDAKKELMRYS